MYSFEATYQFNMNGVLTLKCQILRSKIFKEKKSWVDWMGGYLFFIVLCLLS